MLRFVKTIALHFRILADMMFLTGTGEEQSHAACDEPGAEKNGAHADATVVGKVSAVQLKVRVFPADVGIQLKGAPGELLSATWAGRRRTVPGMRFLHSSYLVSAHYFFWR